MLFAGFQRLVRSDAPTGAARSSACCCSIVDTDTPAEPRSAWAVDAASSSSIVRPRSRCRSSDRRQREHVPDREIVEAADVGAPGTESPVRSRLAAGGRWIRTSGTRHKSRGFPQHSGHCGDRGALKRYYLIVQPFFFCASNSGGTGIAHPLRPDVWTNDDHVGNARRSTSAWPARAVRAQGSGHGAAAGRNRLDPVDP